MTEVAHTKDGFDYGALDPAIATPLHQQAERIRARLGRHTADIIETGNDLLAVKEKLDHGTFGAWVEKDLKLPKRTAQAFMSAARLAEKNASIALFQPTTVYRLAAKGTPEDIRDAILSRAESGDIPRDREVKDAIARAARLRFQEEQRLKEQQLRANRREESARALAKREQEEAAEEERRRRIEERIGKIVDLISQNLDPTISHEIFALIKPLHDSYGVDHRGKLLIDGLYTALTPKADDGLDIPAALRRAH